MIENIEKEQLQDICSGLLKGFIEWVDMNDGAEKAIILDSAYQFKLSMLEQDHVTLQKKYFLSSPRALRRGANYSVKSMETDIFSVSQF